MAAFVKLTKKSYRSALKRQYLSISALPVDRISPSETKRTSSQLRLKRLRPERHYALYVFSLTIYKSAK
jgi:hypothetical protein